jgi:hypothetical protein
MPAGGRSLSDRSGGSDTLRARHDREAIAAGVVREPPTMQRYEPKDPRQSRISRTMTSPLLGLVPIAAVALAALLRCAGVQL